LRPTKTVSSEAVLPLPELCLQALTAHRALTNGWRLAAGPAWHDNDLVLSTRYGLQSTHETSIASSRSAPPRLPCRWSRFPQPAARAPRYWSSSTSTPRVAMRILRHSQIAVTMDIYSQVTSASTREAL
jgi:hypothetical protein